MPPDPTLIGDILPDLAVSLSLRKREARGERLDVENRIQYGVMENNLGRKAIWWPLSGPPSTPSVEQQVLEFESRDVVGHLVIHSAMGRLTIYEMEVVSWILGKWVENENPDSPMVEFTLAELAREFKVAWGGSRAQFTKHALEKLDRVRFTAEVWSASRGELVTEHFGIFDRVTIKERKTARLGPQRGPAPVRVKLNDFLYEQLKMGQFHRYSWQVLRGNLSSPLAKRLYVFLDGQRGYETEEGWLYEHKIDAELLATLGINDTNERRARRHISAACAELAAAEKRYIRCEVRAASNSRRGWVLSAVRSRPARVMTSLASTPSE